MLTYRLFLAALAMAVISVSFAQEITPPGGGDPAESAGTGSADNTQPNVDVEQIIDDGKGHIAVPVDMDPMAIERVLGDCEGITVMIGTHNILLPVLDNTDATQLAQRIIAATRGVDGVKLHLLNKHLLIQTPQTDLSRPELQNSGEIARRVMDALLGRGEDAIATNPNDSDSKLTANMVRATSTPNDSEELPLICFSPKYANATEVARVVGQLYGDQSDSIMADERSNVLFVRCGPDLRRKIEHLLKALDKASARDVADSSSEKQLFSFYIGFDRDSLDTLRSRSQELEQESRELAVQLQSPAPDPGIDLPMKQRLRNTVRQSFEARQKLQRAELAEFARRLQKIQKSIDTRDHIAQQIVDRRVKKLLDPNLEWDLPNETQTDRKASSGTSQTSGPMPGMGFDAGPQNAPEPGPGVTQPADSKDNILLKTPEELHELLTTRAKQIEQLRENTRRWEKRRSEGRDPEEVDDAIASQQKQLQVYRRKQVLAEQEYLQQIKLLEAVLQREQNRLEVAEAALREAERLHTKGYISTQELRSTQLRRQEVQVALQRAESLLKLYQQAGEGLISTPVTTE